MCVSVHLSYLKTKVNISTTSRPRVDIRVSKQLSIYLKCPYDHMTILAYGMIIILCQKYGFMDIYT